VCKVILICFVTGCNITGVDLVIVLDISMSVHRREAVQPILQFTRRIIQRLDVGLDSTLVGVAFFANYTRFHFGLQEHTSRQALLSAKDKLSMDYPEERFTNFVPLLRFLSEVSDDTSWGFRPDYPDVAIIVTDGRSTDHRRGKELGPAVEEFRRQSIYQLYAVGVGNASLMELVMITGSTTTTFFANELDDRTLAQTAQRLTERLCSRSELNFSP